MTPDDALKIADEALIAHAGNPLTDIQRMILRESLAGKGYEGMEGYTPQHIKNEGKKLWDLLSKALGEKVSKTSFKGAMEKRLHSNNVAVKPSMPSTYTPQPVTTVLILSANPKGTSPLRLDEERREIETGLIERSRLRDNFRLVSKVAVRSRDVQRAMLDHTPQVVHFSGHGAGEQGLALEDETGNVKLVYADALAALFELFADSLQCVLLNACYSEVQAKAISQHIPYVIGMSDKIGDRAAIEFAVAFYDALGAGRDMEFAYKSACVAIKLAGIPQEHIPVLHPKPELSAFAPETIVESLSKKQENIFSDLETFLQNHQWEEADGETARLMIRLSGDETETQFKIDALNDFSCNELLEIDGLWKKYSQEKFGFTIQKNIWSRSRRDFDIFSSKVGWRIGNTWLEESDLKYDLTAPQGHLPSLHWIHVQGWAIGNEKVGHNLHKLLEKLLSCLAP